MSKKKTNSDSNPDHQDDAKSNTKAEGENTPKDAKSNKDEAPKTEEPVDEFASLREAPRRKPREKWRRGFFGLILAALPLGLIFLPSLAPAAFVNESSYDVIRLMIAALLAIGCSLTVSAFFDIDVQASFDIPGLKKGTAQAVGGLVLVLMLGGAFYMGLPSLKPERKPQSMSDAIAKVFEDHGIVTGNALVEAMNQNRAAILSDDSFRDSIADRLIESMTNVAAVNRAELVEDIFFHSSRGLSIKADVAIGKNPNLDTNSLEKIVMPGEWSTSTEPQPSNMLDGLTVRLENDETQKLFYYEQGQSEPLIMSILKVNPEDFRLSFYLFLAEERLRDRLCRPIGNLVTSQPNVTSFGKEEG